MHVPGAHNSHLGDARYTDMGKRRGEVNLGQLLRERYGTQAVFNIGFTTHAGWVAAADEWGGPVKKKRVRASMEGVQLLPPVLHRPPTSFVPGLCMPTKAPIVCCCLTGPGQRGRCHVVRRCLQNL